MQNAIRTGDATLDTDLGQPFPRNYNTLILEQRNDPQIIPTDG